MGDGIEGLAGGVFYTNSSEEDAMGGGVIFKGNEFEPTASKSYVEATIEDYAAAAEGAAVIYMWGTPENPGMFQVAAPADEPALNVTAAHRGLMAGWDNQEVSFTGTMDPKLAAGVANFMAFEQGLLTTVHGLHLGKDVDVSEPSDTLESVLADIGKMAQEANAGVVPNLADPDDGKAFLDWAAAEGSTGLEA